MIYFVSDYELKDPNICNVHHSEVDSIPDLWLEDFIGWDTETTGLCQFYDKPLLEIFGDDSDQIVIDLIRTPYDVIEKIHDRFKAKTWIAHNAKFDYKFIRWHFPKLFIGNIYDTMVASRIIYNGFGKIKHSLDYLLDKVLHIPMEKSTRVSFIKFDTKRQFNVAQVKYAAKDTEFLDGLRIALNKNVEKFEYTELVNLENKVIKVLGDIELGGIRFDAESWRKQAKVNEDQFNLIIAELDSLVLAMARRYPLLRNRLLNVNKRKSPFNYKSSNDIVEILQLCDALRYFKPRTDVEEFITSKVNKKEASKKKKVTGKFSNGVVYNNASIADVEITRPEIKTNELFKMGKAELEAFLQNEESLQEPEIRAFISKILEHRKKAKEISTYGEKFIKDLGDATGRAHTEFRQVNTVTGRLSSSKYSVDKRKSYGYNAQNIPRNADMRHCFLADEGYEVLTADYSGQETVLAASQSKDPMLVGNVMEGLDLHSYLAQPTFRMVTGDDTLIVSEKVNKHYRTAHKPILFGMFYGAGANRVAQVLNIPRSIANRVYDNIKGLLPEFFKYQKKVQEFAKTNMYIHDHSKYKRRRWFTKDDPTHRIEKQASNFPMQSSGASMIKEALVAIDEYLVTFREEFPLCRILGTVHDEIIIQIPIGRHDIANRCVEIMEEVGNSFVDGVTIKASMLIEPYWTK